MRSRPAVQNHGDKPNYYHNRPSKKTVFSHCFFHYSDIGVNVVFPYVIVASLCYSLPEEVCEETSNCSQHYSSQGITGGSSNWEVWCVYMEYYLRQENGRPDDNYIDYVSSHYWEIYGELNKKPQPKDSRHNKLEECESSNFC